MKSLTEALLKKQKREWMMAKYRRLPVIIEAIQWTGENYGEMLKFIGEKKFHHIVNDNTLLIPTLEVDHKAAWGDYIIKEGITDEVYPCNPDIFEKTYEVV